MTFNELLTQLNQELGPSRCYLGHFEWRITTALPIVALAAVVNSVEQRPDALDIALVERMRLN